MQYTVKQVFDITDNNIVGNFLYGSQNYGLDHEGSDEDTILLVHTADKPKQEIDTAAGKMKIYTLDYFIYRLKQGDMECYEILYTRYRTINPIYEDCLTNFVEEFSKCMSYERIKHSLRNKLDEHLSHVLWIIRNDDGGRYNKKRLHWAMRVCNQLERINQGETFESSLIYRTTRDYDLIKIKTISDYLSLKDFNVVYKYLVDYIQSSPRYSKSITDEEEKCLSNFYTNIITTLHDKGGNSTWR